MSVIDKQNEARSAALKATKEMVRQLRIAYPHRVPDSIRRTCAEYVRHVLTND